MTKFYCIACLLAIMLLTAFGSFAQDDTPRVRNGNEGDEIKRPEPEKGFKKENLFAGGSVSASFGSGFTVLGANPTFGYKLNDYLDAGVVLNYVYTGIRDYEEINDKLRQHTFGPGVFMRAYPVSFLFAQAQPEFNIISQKITDADGSISGKYNVSAPSLLLGGGFATGRAKGSTTFFYMSLLFDVLKNRNSPYVDFDPTGQRDVRMVPIIRAGVNVGLFQGRFKRSGGYY